MLNTHHLTLSLGTPSEKVTRPSHSVYGFNEGVGTITKSRLNVQGTSCGRDGTVSMTIWIASSMTQLDGWRMTELEAKMDRIRDLRDEIADKVGDFLEELSQLGEHITVEQALFHLQLKEGVIDLVSNRFLVGIEDTLEGAFETISELEERYGGKDKYGTDGVFKEDSDE